LDRDEEEECEWERKRRRGKKAKASHEDATPNPWALRDLRLEIPLAGMAYSGLHRVNASSTMQLEHA